MTHEELKALLRSLQSDGAFEMIPHRNDNGADSYSCPACGASTQIKGYAYGGGSPSEVQHYKDCKLLCLLGEIDSWDEE